MRPERFGRQQLQSTISIDFTLRFWQSRAYETTVA
jgi:hypothetical protein